MNPIPSSDLRKVFFSLQETVLSLSNRTAYKQITGLDVYAEGLVRKFILHSMALRKQLERGGFYSELDSRPYAYIDDPITASTTARAMYEVVLVFAHIYIDPPTKDESFLRFAFWELSSLISKSQSNPTGSPEDAANRVEITKQINELVDFILDLPIVKGLSRRSQDMIKQKRNPNAKDRWEYYIGDNNELLSAEGTMGLQKRLKANPNAYSNLYKILSQDAHPSQTSVKKVLNAFELNPANGPTNIELIDAVVNFSISITILLIYDYVNHFSAVAKEYAKFNATHQLMIDDILSQFKGRNFYISKLRHYSFKFPLELAKVKAGILNSELTSADEHHLLQVLHEYCCSLVDLSSADEEGTRLNFDDGNIISMHYCLK